MSGVPVGAQVLMLSISTTGAPPAKTRVAAAVYVPVTQGPLPPGGTKPQPATTQGDKNGVDRLELSEKLHGKRPLSRRHFPIVVR